MIISEGDIESFFFDLYKCRPTPTYILRNRAAPFNRLRLITPYRLSQCPLSRARGLMAF